jgi:hypothetical protein
VFNLFVLLRPPICWCCSRLQQDQGRDGVRQGARQGARQGETGRERRRDSDIPTCLTWAGRAPCGHVSRDRGETERGAWRDRRRNWARQQREWDEPRQRETRAETGGGTGGRDMRCVRLVSRDSGGRGRARQGTSETWRGKADSRRHAQTDSAGQGPRQGGARQGETGVETAPSPVVSFPVSRNRITCILVSVRVSH